jgi:putative mRNA 3-end processing factor
MILNDFLILNEQGYYCKYGDFYIDAKVAVNVNLVSHAHADHARPGSKNVYTTSPSIDFMKYRYGNNAAKVFMSVDFNSVLELNGVQIQFIKAGHMLGSAQILMLYKGVRYLYSGDIKLQKDHSCEKVEFVQCDVLITETTFAYPEVIHPKVESEIQNLLNYTQPIVIGTYALGKAQRLSSLCKQYVPDVPLYIHYDILPYHKIYQKHNYLNWEHSLLQKKDIRQGRQGIYLVPPLTYQSYKAQYSYTFAFASGWSNLQEHKHKLYVSDHLDWPDLLEYIKYCAPQEIWTIHGESKHLIAHFGSSNIKVKEINNEGRN